VPELLDREDKMSRLGYEQIHAAAAAIRDRFDLKEAPKIGLVLGSGLGPFAEHIKPLGKMKSLPYSSIVHFPTSSVQGHSGQLHYGAVSGVPILAMQGRVHCYEGYSANDAVFPVRVLAALGVKTLILTNAAGAINTAFNAGDLMLITDQINMMGDNPLIGPNDERLGPRFFDMTEAYSKRGRRLALEAAAREKILLREGCYVSVQGPCYETPTEVRMMRGWGADAAGMSTVLECIAARHMGVEVVGFSCLTNMAAGITGATLNHEEVQETAQIASDRFSRLLKALIPELTR
jgi:purine-nucleoside phosphorylase